MPHPDAYLYAFQHPLWFRRPRNAEEDEAECVRSRPFFGPARTRSAEDGTPHAFPEEGAGIAIFRNGVDTVASGL